MSNNLATPGDIKKGYLGEIFKMNHSKCLESFRKQTIQLKGQC